MGLQGGPSNLRRVPVSYRRRHVLSPRPRLVLRQWSYPTGMGLDAPDIRVDNNVTLAIIQPIDA
jgi:hypothetical protein